MKYALTTILLLGIIFECVLITRLREVASPDRPFYPAPRTTASSSPRRAPLAQPAPPATRPEPWLTITVKPNPYGSANGPVHLPDLATMKRQSQYFMGPELAKAKALDLRMAATLRYGALLAKLRLTIPQREAMITQLARFMSLRDDVRESIANLPPYRTTLREQDQLYRSTMSREQTAITTTIASLVGEAGLTTFLDYELHLDRYATATALDQIVRTSSGRAIAPDRLAVIAETFAGDSASASRALRPVTDEIIGQMQMGGLRLRDLSWERVAISAQGELNSTYAPSAKVVRWIETAGLLQPGEVQALHTLVEQRQAQQTMYTMVFR